MPASNNENQTNVDPNASAQDSGAGSGVPVSKDDLEKKIETEVLSQIEKEVESLDLASPISASSSTAKLNEGGIAAELNKRKRTSSLTDSFEDASPQLNLADNQVLPKGDLVSRGKNQAPSSKIRNITDRIARAPVKRLLEQQRFNDKLDKTEKTMPGIVPRRGEVGKNKSQEEQNESELNARRLKTEKTSTSLKTKSDKQSPTAKFKIVTDKILQAAIRYVPASFTLSAFYVYFHVLASQSFPRLFSSLGHEWVSQNIKQAKPEEAKRLGDKIGLVEKSAVSCCCFVHLIIIIIIVAIIYFILNPGEVLLE